MEDRKTLYPGDNGYLGGTFITEVYDAETGKTFEITTIKDSNGNIVSVSKREKLFGLL